MCDVLPFLIVGAESPDGSSFGVLQVSDFGDMLWPFFDGSDHVNCKYEFSLSSSRISQRPRFYAAGFRGPAGPAADPAG